MALFHGATYAGPCETMFSHKFPVTTQESIQDMIVFFAQNKSRLLFSADCKYRKMVFAQFLESVGEAVKPYGTLGNYIKDCYGSDDALHLNYRVLQDRMMNDLYHWGRMGHWCFSEALHRFTDAPIMAPTMEFGPTGKSHTSGWAFCIGRDDLVAKMDADELLTSEEVALLERTAAEYLEKYCLRHCLQGKINSLAQFFTLETACCNYKRQFKGSRYGGCYIDEQHTEITQMRHDWPEFTWLWDKYMEGRQAVIPHSMLFENHHDISDVAYQKSWLRALKEFGRIPRAEAWHNQQPQMWRDIRLMPWYKSSDNTSLEELFA